MPSDQVWPNDRSMTRLERDIQAFCGDLVKNITPASVSLSWTDNLHPHAPLLSEAYVVSMFERELIRKGFTVQDDDERARYRLMLIMTPSKKSLLILASLRHGDKVLSTKEHYFAKGREDWSRELGSYRFRTRNIIHVGSRP